MKGRFCLSLLLLTIVSCVPLDYYGNFWRRDNRDSTFFQKKYEPIDTLTINNIRFCKKQNEINLKRLKTKGQLTVSVKDAEKNIINVLKEKFNQVNYKLKNDTIGTFNCNYLTRENILLGNYKNYLKEQNAYSAEITVNLEYISSRDYVVDGFYSSTPEVLFEDRHHIIIIFRIAILNKNELIYMDNYSHNKTIMTEFDKDVSYEIAKNITDNLVVKSLTEYKNRLE